MLPLNSLELVVINVPIVKQVEETLRNTHVNGDVIINCYKVNNEEIFNFPTLFEEYEPYFTQLLTLKDISRTISQLQISENVDCEINFEWVSPFTLDGDFASCIFNGGAYGGFSGTPREAKNLAEEFCNFIFGDRFIDIQVYKSCLPWSPWFYNVAWDKTWLIFDTTMKRLWIICTTDTD